MKKFMIKLLLKVLINDFLFYFILFYFIFCNYCFSAMFLDIFNKRLKMTKEFKVCFKFWKENSNNGLVTWAILNN